jgi:hypothetical protein
VVRNILDSQGWSVLSNLVSALERRNDDGGIAVVVDASESDWLVSAVRTKLRLHPASHENDGLS